MNNTNPKSEVQASSVCVTTTSRWQLVGTVRSFMQTRHGTVRYGELRIGDEIPLYLRGQMKWEPIISIRDQVAPARRVPRR